MSSRSFVLGLCMAVGGLAGAVRSVADGESIWKSLGLLGIGVLGVVLAVAWIMTYTRKR